MSRVVESLAGVTGRRDGEGITVRVDDGRATDLSWNPAYNAGTGAWIGESVAPLMRMMGNLGSNFPGNPTDWRYPADHVEDPNPDIDPRALGFAIHTVEGPGPFLSAGLTLQESLVGLIQPRGTVTVDNDKPRVGLNYYSLAEGGPFLTPVPNNFGVELVAASSDNLIWTPCSSGWQNSPAVAPSSGANWYPELYGTGVVFNLRNFYAARRWVAGDVGGTGGSGAPSKFPPISDVTVWLDARSIPVADGGHVAEWPNYSGRGGHPAQATSGKQPLVRRDSPGAIRHVRGDGVNDILTTTGTPAIAAQPFTLVLVIRQNTGGNTQEVWAGAGGGGAPLLYKGDASDQVNMWGGASDLIYHRSSAWPMPFTMLTFVFDGATSTIYENTTLKASGDSSHPGTNGIGGLSLFNNFAETLPAKVDIAAVVLAAATADATKVGDLHTYFAAEIGI